MAWNIVCNYRQRAEQGADMKIVIGNATYTQIKNLSFAPETDITGGSIPVNRFTVEIHTDDAIETGANGFLYDDDDNLWAKYWITESVIPQVGWVKITAQSIITLLDRFTLPAAVYNAEPIDNVLQSIFAPLYAVYPSDTWYVLDNALSGATITGYCPEQKARDRLLWVVFVIGAYVKSYFNEYIEIKALDSTQTTIPDDKTFWKPEVNYTDYVTAVKVRAYTYTQGTPQTVDKWVQVGNDYYIETYQDYTLTNPDVPITAVENVKKIEKVMIVNENNVSAVLSHLAQYYFKRIEVSADVLNMGEYQPADKCLVNTGDRLISGFIKSATFTFGHGSKSQIRLVQSDEVEAANLTIEYVYDNDVLRRVKYLMPVGYSYSISNPYIDMLYNDHRYIFRPLSSAATGTVVSGGVTDQESMDIAIDAYEQEVYIIDVDSATESNEVVSIG